MATAKAKSQQVPQPDLHPINAKFKDRLPEIMNEIWRSVLVIEPETERMTIPMREFLDHLEFEIDKAELTVARQKWQDRVDPAKLKADQEWLAKLLKIKNDFNIEVMTSIVPLMRDMLKRVQEAFGKLSGVADGSENWRKAGDPASR